MRSSRAPSSRSQRIGDRSWRRWHTSSARWQARRSQQGHARPRTECGGRRRDQNCEGKRHESGGHKSAEPPGGAQGGRRRASLARSGSMSAASASGVTCHASESARRTGRPDDADLREGASLNSAEPYAPSSRPVRLGRPVRITDVLERGRQACTSSSPSSIRCSRCPRSPNRSTTATSEPHPPTASATLGAHAAMLAEQPVAHAFDRAPIASLCASKARSHSVSVPIERLFMLAEPTRSRRSSTTMTLEWIMTWAVDSPCRHFGTDETNALADAGGLQRLPEPNAAVSHGGPRARPRSDAAQRSPLRGSVAGASAAPAGGRSRAR